MYFPRVVPHARGRSARLAVISLVCLLLLISELAVPSSSQRRPSIYEYTEGRTSPWPEQGNETESAPQGLDEAAYLRYLAQTYGLSNDLTWYARRIRPSMSSSLSSRGRASVTEIDRKFVATQLMRARVTDDRLRLETEKSISLPVPRSPLDAEIDASSLLFGISTTYSRLVYANHSLVRDWERWLTDGRRGSNGAGLVLTLHKASGEDVERASRALHAVGIDAVVQQSADHSDSATRYVELVRLLRSHAESTSDAKGPNKKYLALLDDDVFLPSMSRLIQRLSQFDPAREYYIGAPSERSDWAVERGTTITSGGGAVFLTLPMAERVVQLPCLGGGADQDRDQPPRGVAHWDLSLYRCITTHTDVSLQVLPSYYSPDDDDGGGEGEEGDSSGSSSSLGSGPNNEGYGSGMQPLTLHHYKNWHRFEAGAGHLVASACGEACFLQRFRFQDDWILVNGFALSQYPDGAEAVPVPRWGRLLAEDA
ncbi:hypothetical protein VTK73DRAFT_1057 [Phialemonium thermophilum]|uniref:Glycosyltransferase family 31 protein n=1 Tax=Phialemonium thermophilum TaxID=223376 RepID=A0ABR3VU01_9PEZI